VRIKGEGSVKGNAEELGSGVECKGGASQSELVLMRNLMGVRTEEATFTFSGVDWEAPFQKGGASQSELGLMRNLIGVRTEEATFTFSGVDWEVPFQGPFFKVIEGFLDRVGSFQPVRGGRPNSEIISIE